MLTDEAIKAAYEAVLALDGPASLGSLEIVEAALEAAESLIGAQALEEAARDFPADLPEFAILGENGLIDYTDVSGWLMNEAFNKTKGQNV